MTILVSAGFQVAHGRQPAFVESGEEVGQIILVVYAIHGSSDQHRIARPRVVYVGGLRVIHEWLVMWNVVTSIRDRIVSGETCMMLAAYGVPLRVHTRRREAALKPAPSDAPGVQQ